MKKKYNLSYNKARNLYMIIKNSIYFYKTQKSVDIIMKNGKIDYILDIEYDENIESFINLREINDDNIKKNKKIKPPVPRWQTAGYKKKATCDRCGFRAKYSAQLLVYHADGNLQNNNLKNLKTVCHNCVVDLKRTGSTWRPGDLQPDP